MDLAINTPLEVNINQFNWVKINCKGLLAHRTDEAGKHWIKPLCFLGYKKVIQEALEKLS